MTNPFEHPSLIVLESQPDFPDTDLTEANADIIGDYYLPETPAVRLEGLRLQLDQHQLFQTALMAYQLSGLKLKLDYVPDHYGAFTEGFASYAFIQTLVTAGQYDTERAVSRMQALYMGLGAVDILPPRIEAWADVRPNLYQTVLKQGVRLREPAVVVQARLLGAQVAFELQRPILDRAS